MSPKFRKILPSVLAKTGRASPIHISPSAIFTGNPTISILIWGTVLAINPNPILIIKSIAKTGAPILIAMTNISFES
ncbi:MAG: hypothetical protein PF495_11475, partial [Spirochaetales bacterium]|nr:hypothetical protein [Spirochaetales bacterium]